MMYWLKLMRGMCLLVALVGAGIGTVSIFSAPVYSTPQTTASHLNANDPIRLVFAPENAPEGDQPFLLTRSGIALQPVLIDTVGTRWQPMNLSSRVQDLYIDHPDTMWAGTDEGLFRFQDGTWQPVAGVAPTQRLVSTHGFLFALGGQSVARLPEGTVEGAPEWKQLTTPEAEPGGMISNLVMLGNHSHVLWNSRLALTPDLGLSWKPLPDAPAGLQSITTDEEGNLLAVTDQDVRRWNYQSQTWSIVAILPDQTAIEALTFFQSQLYALAGGQLYRLNRSAWEKVEFLTETGYYFTGLQYHYPSTLWVADAEHQTLWWTEDGRIWQSEPIQLMKNTP